MDYYIHLAILVSIYLILAQSLNLSFGLGRLFNLAHVSSYAIGAYVAALFSTGLELSFWVCLVCATCLSALLALPINAIAARLTQDYFAIGTLAFSAVITALLVNWKSVTNGVLGVSAIPRPTVMGVELMDNTLFLLLSGALAFIAQVILYVLFRGGLARRMRAEAEYEEAALALGCNARTDRLVGLCVASGLAGLAGCLFAFYINYIDPSSFGFAEMIFVLTIVVVGRPGSFWGVIAGTVFLVLLPEPLRFVNFSPAYVGPMRQMLYAVILFLVVAWNRERLFPIERRV